MMIRKISFFALFSFSIFFAFAQTNPLEKRATLQVKNQPLENVLDVITEQTNVRFSYNSQLVNPKTKVTVHAQNKTVKEILAAILPASVSYKKVGEHIVFYKQNTEIQKPEKIEPIVTELPLVEKPEIIQENSFSDNGNEPVSCLDSVSLTKTEDMKSQIAGLMLAAATATSAPVLAQDSLPVTSYELTELTQPENEEPEEVTPQKCKPVQLTFIYPLGTGWTKSSLNCYHFSLNILGGVTGQTKGFEMGGLFNINKYGATGAQFAGLFNITGSQCSEFYSRTAQFAGVFNLTPKGKSAQFAGVFNIGDTAYFQAGGVFNIAKKGGAQFAGVFNIGDTAYFQAGGVFNIAKKGGDQAAGVFNQGCDVPFQAAGVVNVGCNTPFQAAGIVNTAEKSACQLAGVVNITKEGKFQMGLINVRDTADGVSLGLINIVKKGGIMEAGIEAGEFIHTALTFRSGVQRLYSIVSVGYNYTQNFWSVGGGVGTSFILKGNLSLNLELTYANLYQMKRYRHYTSGWRSLTQFIPMLHYRFAKHFKIYVGPSVNFHLYSAKYRFGSLDAPPEKLRPDVPYRITEKYEFQGNRARGHDFWVGVVGGIKF